MYCEKCGKEISNYSLMCRHCSSDISPDYEFLTAQAILKDKEALAALYTATYKSAYFVAYRMTKNEDNAVDILHDCYIKAFANLDTIAEPKKFDKWFNRIVANKCLDYLKRRKPMFLEDVYGEEFEEELPDDRYGNNPQIYSENEDINRIVRQIIEELPEEQRLCVLMYYYDEMSVRDIAEELGVSENTVKSRLRLARNRIKAEIERLENKGYEFRAVVIGPFIMRCLNDMETNTPIKDVGFENIYNEVAGAVPHGSGAYQAAKAAKGAVHSAVKTKIIIGLICGAAAVAGIAGVVHMANNDDNKTPTIADSSVSDTTTDTSSENSAMTTTTVASETKAAVSSEAESVAESSVDSSEAESEEGWRDAYRELVNGYESLDYHLYSGSSLPDLLSYALYDIDQDGVPELIFLANDTGDYFRVKTCTVYSWNGSEAYEVSDFGFSMGNIGEFSDKKQFAITEFDSFSGTTKYYSVDMSDGELTAAKAGDASADNLDSYEKQISYKILPQITLIGSSYTGESLVPDDVTELIDDYVSEKPEKEEKTEKSESSDNLNKFIGMNKDELVNDYFDGKYEAAQISRGQEYILSYKNSSKLPYCEFGVDGSTDKVSVINVTEGGELSDKIKIGMTYNELKEVCDFDMAYATFTTYDTSIDVTIDGEKWHIAFSLTDKEMAQVGLNNVTIDNDAGVHQFDLSGINPKSTMGYYTEGN